LAPASSISGRNNGKNITNTVHPILFIRLDWIIIVQRQPDAASDAIHARLLILSAQPGMAVAAGHAELRDIELVKSIPTVHS
jgi:hypothetical protein